MKAQCPHCNQSYPELDDQLNGQIVTCGKCNQEFVAKEMRVNADSKNWKSKITINAFNRIPYLIGAANIISLLYFLFCGYYIFALICLSPQPSTVVVLVSALTDSFLIAVASLVAASVLAALNK